MIEHCFLIFYLLYLLVTNMKLQLILKWIINSQHLTYNLSHKSTDQYLIQIRKYEMKRLQPGIQYQTNITLKEM